MIKTLKFRIKDSAKPWLNRLAKEVNFVWNYINDLSYKTIKNKNKFLSAFDINYYLSGATKGDCGLSLHSQTLYAISDEFITCRNKAKKRKLKWRKSSGNKKSLGWIPFKAGNSIRLRKGIFYYGKKNRFKVWDSYGIQSYEFRSGDFNEDSKGNWYLNIQVEVPATQALNQGEGEIGIDLGLKDLATMSDGTKIEAKKFYHKSEAKLATAQRAHKKKQVKAIHAKIKNQRKDFLHKASTKLVQENKLIVVGDVNSSKLAKTNMAKSVLDAGWSMFRTMLEFKAIRQQTAFMIVNEAWTSRTCNACNERTGPQGLVGLGIREWTCEACGAVLDRDTNAAINILRLGHQSLVAGVMAPLLAP